MAQPPSVHVDTSMEAAEAIKPVASSIRARVLKYIRECGTFGATEEMVEDYLKLDGNTIRPRIWELMKEGKVIDSGSRGFTKSGRKARVLMCPEFL